MSSQEALQAIKDLWLLIKRADERLDLNCCRAVVKRIESNINKVPHFKIDTFTRTLAVARKTFRVKKREAVAAEDNEARDELDDILKRCEKLDTTLRTQEEEGNKLEADAALETTDNSDDMGLPKSVAHYQSRLKRQRKELYKDPPVLPPHPIAIEEKYVGEPTRDANGFLHFVGGQEQKYLPTALKEFCPNVTPAEILQGGAFGGTYFRSIHSAVTNKRYNGLDVVRDSVRPEWIEGLDSGTTLISATYRVHVNKFRAKCGGSLGMWESSGWISNGDPYGWFQWYCRFYQGRRSSDDMRQIARWKALAGPKGRFRSQLCNKVLQARTHAGDLSISPVIRQTLWHWGLELNDFILGLHQKNAKKK